MSKIYRILRHGLLALMLLAAFGATAQTVIVPTGQTTQLNGKKYYYHVVGQGESVFAIARAYGLHYSAAVLRTDLQHVNANDTVWLPINDQSRAAVQRAIGTTEAAAGSADATTQTIKVEQGMTLYNLTKSYKTTAQELYKLNPGLETDGLKTGQNLVVPKVNAAGSNAAKSNTSSTSKPSAAKPQSTAKPQEGQYHYQSPTPSGNKSPQPSKSAAAEKAVATPPSIRDRINAETLYITVMIPLRLDKMGEISTTKFDVDQRGKKDYKSFEFIQFYEGMLMALDELSERGINVRLNVVDIPDENENTIRQAYSSHNVAQSDLLIALLQRKGFEVAAGLAKADRLFVVNPLSSRCEILQDNPYVVKYMPSIAGKTEALAGAIRLQYANAPVYLITSGAKEEEPAKTAWENQLKKDKIKYTLVDWTRQQSKLPALLKGDHQAVVVSLYDRGKEKNRIQTNLLLNRMNSLKTNTPMLITMSNLVRDMGDVDFNQLQNCSYHFVYPTYLDYNDATQKKFIDAFKEKYKTDPMGEFAGAAYDIMLFFGTTLNQSGSDYWKTLKAPAPAGMLFPLRLQQSGNGDGLENQAGNVYEMIDFQLRAVPLP